MVLVALVDLLSFLRCTRTEISCTAFLWVSPPAAVPFFLITVKKTLLTEWLTNNLNIKFFTISRTSRNISSLLKKDSQTEHFFTYKTFFLRRLILDLNLVKIRFSLATLTGSSTRFMALCQSVSIFGRFRPQLFNIFSPHPCYIPNIYLTSRILSSLCVTAACKHLQKFKEASTVHHLWPI